MTELLQHAFDIVSGQLSNQEQDFLAHLMIDDVKRLRDILEEEAEERRFDASVLNVVKSEKIQELLGKVAEKYDARTLS